MHVSSRVFTFLAFTFVGLNTAFAGTYAEDLEYLKNALRQSHFSEASLEDYRDPLVGKTEFRLPENRAPWAGNYFPMADGGIANRWQLGPGKYMNPANKPTMREIQRLTPDQINLLSPAEKFDLLRSDYNFSLTEHELNYRGPLRPMPPQDWEGFCNGVRCAGVLLPEPQRDVIVTNSEGVEIRFKPADLKALAGASYFYVEKYSQMGSPSRVRRGETPPNAAVFDMALRYFLAEKKKAFLIDSHLGSEIWNESVVGYKRTLSAQRKLTPAEASQYPYAVSKVVVDVELDSLSELDILESNAPTKARVANGELHQTVFAKYVLFLDANGNAVDGRWNKSRVIRGIDFVWFGAGRGTDAYELNGNRHLEYAQLRKLFRKSSRPMTCRSLF